MHAPDPNHRYGQGSPKQRRMRRHRERLFERQGGKCYWCGGQMEMVPYRVTERGNVKHNPAYATFEHLIPKSHGGIPGMVNCVLAHPSCNGNREKRKWPNDPIFGPVVNGQGPKAPE